jgi:hypothetical protein
LLSLLFSVAVSKQYENTEKFVVFCFFNEKKKKKATEVSPRLKSTLLEDKEFWFGEQRLWLDL